MKLTINGKIKEFNEKVTILELLESENIVEPVAVEVIVNKTKISHKDFDKFILKDGDKIEYIYLFASG